MCNSYKSSQFLSIVCKLFFSAALSFIGSANAAACTHTLASNADLVWLRNNVGSMAPGSVVCINAGTYTEQLTIYLAHGSVTAPIQVVPSDGQHPPVLNAGILVRGSAYINLSGMTVFNSPSALAAILLDQGSHDIQISGMTAQNAQFGIGLGSGVYGGMGGPAGNNNLIYGNTVLNSLRGGIAVSSRSDGAPGRLNRIAYNMVTNSGGHGIDIDDTSYVQVDHNTVSASGTGVGIDPAGGYSGIHLFAPADVPGRCTQNIVRYNKVYGTTERPTFYDGNGIQIDHFCDANEVSFNVVWNNAGAGIAIYIAKLNQVFSNTLIGNQNQPDRISQHPPQWNPVGEITLSTAMQFNGQNTQGRTTQNRVYDNIVDATTTNTVGTTVYGEPGINVDYSAAPYGNVVGPNFAWSRNATGGRVAMYYNSVAYTDGGGMDRVTGTVGNLVERPRFVDAGHPLSDGLDLSVKPSSCGDRVAPTMADIVAVWPQDGSCNFGAYYKN